jgi:hypothetical protein
MRLVSFARNGQEAVDLSRAAPGLPGDRSGILEIGD